MAVFTISPLKSTSPKKVSLHVFQPNLWSNELSNFRISKAMSYGVQRCTIYQTPAVRSEECG